MQHLCSSPVAWPACLHALTQTSAPLVHSSDGPHHIKPHIHVQVCSDLQQEVGNSSAIQDIKFKIEQPKVND